MGQTARQIFMLNGLNDTDSCKDVPFLALVNIAAHLGDQIAQKNNFGGVNRHSLSASVLTCRSVF